jgi:hypothetical protein
MYATSNKRKNFQKDSSASEPKRKKSVLSIKQKENVIKSIEEQGKSAEQVAIDNNLSVSTVYKIVKNKEQLFEFTKNNPNSAFRKALKLTTFPELEKALLEWFKQQQKENQPITQLLLALKSRELYDQIYKGQKNAKPFKGSFGFIQKFCQRNQISLKNINGKSDSNRIPDNIEANNEGFLSLNDCCPNEQVMVNKNNEVVNDVIIEENDIFFQPLPVISSSEVVVYCKYLINWLDSQINNSLKIKEHLEKLIDLAKTNSN